MNGSIALRECAHGNRAALSARSHKRRVIFMKKMIAVLSAAVLCCGALTAPVFAEEEPAKEYMLGDIDEDGEVTVDDAQLVLLSLVHSLVRNPIELTDEQVERSHVLGLEEEGYLYITDAQAILMYSVNKLAGYTDEELKDYFANFANRLKVKKLNGVSYFRQ
jgi:hypothetical protein